KVHSLFAALALTGILTVQIAYAQEQQQQQQRDQQPQSNATQDPSANPSSEPVAPLPAQNDGEDRQAPVPAGRAPFVSLGAQGSNSAETQPDAHALSGALTPGLGYSGGFRTLFDPVFRVTEALDTGTGYTSSFT